MFLDRSKFCKQVFKRVTQGTFLANYFKIGPGVPEEEIFYELLKIFHFIDMATRVFEGIKFCEHFLQRTSQGTFLPSLVQFGPTVWEEKMFKEYVEDPNGRWTLHHPNKLPLSTCSGELKNERKMSRCSYMLSCLFTSHGPCFNPFPNKPWFLPVHSASLLKTLWKKEKLLVTSNLCFSHSVSYPFGELSELSPKLKLSFANSFRLEESKICCLGKGYCS